MAIPWPSVEDGTDSFPTFTQDVKAGFDDGTTFGNGFPEFPSSTAFGETFPPVASSDWQAAWPSLPNSTAPADFGGSQSGGWGFDDLDKRDGFEHAASNQPKTDEHSVVLNKGNEQDFANDTAHRLVSSLGGFPDAPFDVPKGRRKEATGHYLETKPEAEANGHTVVRQTSSKSKIEMQKRIALHDRVPALRRYASDLSEELNSLRAYAGRQAVAAENCIEALHTRAQELGAELIKVQAAGPVSAEAIRQRQAVLREEARVLERRMGSDKFGGTNGPAWTRAEAEKREALEARISSAKDREAAALETALKEMKQSEEKIAMLRIEKRELESRANSDVSTTWKSRYEAFVSAQQALADRVAILGADPGAARLDQALSAASAAAGAATGSHAIGCKKPPDYLLQAVKMLCGLAEAERRRGGLLTEKWRELHGNVVFTGTGSLNIVPPVEQVFSPSPAYAWDLDMCRSAS